MKELFDRVSNDCSKLVTKSYSTSFSLAVNMLSAEIRKDIYNIYGFVRFADEIVDTFHEYDKKQLISHFEKDYYLSKELGISLNPILNSFQQTVSKFRIPDDMVQAFLKSMKADLFKTEYKTKAEYDESIYGSADVVGLMCLKVFVDGKDETYESLKPAAMALGSAFQKVNFLRDLKEDFQGLDRTYFPNVDFTKFDEHSKSLIIQEIEADFNIALEGIFKLPTEARFGVYTAYKYYTKLLSKLKKTPSLSIQKTRIRVPNYQKISVLARSYLKYRLNLL